MTKIIRNDGIYESYSFMTKNMTKMTKNIFNFNTVPNLSQLLFQDLPSNLLSVHSRIPVPIWSKPVVQAWKLVKSALLENSMYGPVKLVVAPWPFLLKAQAKLKSTLRIARMVHATFLILSANQVCSITHIEFMDKIKHYILYF